MADIKLTEKELASRLKSTASFVITQPEAQAIGADLESVRRYGVIDTFGYVSPEMFGAVGDGVHDDAAALKAALESGYPVRMTKDLYIFSNIDIIDKSIYLDGCGHTLHVTGTNMTGYMAKGRCIYVHASMYEGIKEGADVVLYRDSEKANKPFAYTSMYYRGYISYHGFNPTPTREEYVNPWIRSWFEYRAVVKNLNVYAYDCGGMTVFAIFNSCKSLVDGCNFKVIEGDANVGLRMIYSYALKITNCYFDGFNAITSRHIENTGYGMQFGGDGCTVENIFTRQCKHGIVVGGDAQYRSTGVTMHNLTLQAKFDDERASDGARVYQQTLDLHEGVIRPIISNVHIQFDNPTDPERTGTLIMISCEEAMLYNINAQHPNRGYQRAYLGFGPQATKVSFVNLFAPMCCIYGWGWGHERGSQFDSNFMHEITVIGGEIGNIRFADCDLHIRLQGVKVNGYIADARYLYADNCTFKMIDYLGGGRVPITVTGEGWFTHCDISSNLSPTYGKSTPVIAAPENSIYMTNCIIRKKIDRETFKKEQKHIVNTEMYDLFGLVLGSSIFGNSDPTAEHYYIEGEQCYLDEYNLW